MPYQYSGKSSRNSRDFDIGMDALGEVMGNFGKAMGEWGARFGDEMSQMGAEMNASMGGMGNFWDPPGINPQQNHSHNSGHTYRSTYTDSEPGFRTNHFGPINIDDSNADDGLNFGNKVEIGNMYVNNVGYNGFPVYQGGSNFTSGQRRPNRNPAGASTRPTPSRPAPQSGHEDNLPGGKNRKGQSQGRTFFAYGPNDTPGSPSFVSHFASPPNVTGGNPIIGKKIKFDGEKVNISPLNSYTHASFHEEGDDTSEAPEPSDLRSNDLRAMEEEMDRLSGQMDKLSVGMETRGADKISAEREMRNLDIRMRILNTMMKEERDNIARNASSTQGKNSSYSTGYDERAFTSGGAEPFCHTSTSHFPNRPENSTRTSRVFHLDREGGFHTLQEVSNNVPTTNKSQTTQDPDDTQMPKSSTRPSKGKHFTSFSFDDEPDPSDIQSASSKPTFNFNNSFSVDGKVVDGQHFDSNGQDLNFESSKSSRQRPASGRSSFKRRGGKSKRKNVSFDFSRKTGSTDTKKDDLGRGLLGAGSGSSVNYMPATVEDEDQDESDFVKVDEKDFI